MPRLHLSPQFIAAIELPQSDPGPVQTDHIQDQKESRLRAPLSESARLRGTSWAELKALVQE
jgi:hypothetical protein